MADNWTNIGGVDIDMVNPYEMSSYYALEAIRQAVKERCLAVGLSVPALLNEAVKMLYSIKAYTDIIQSTVTTLFGYYANTFADEIENSVRVNHGAFTNGWNDNWNTVSSSGGEDIIIVNSPYNKSFRLSLEDGEYEIRGKSSSTNKVCRCKLKLAYPEITYEVYGYIPKGLTMSLTAWTEATMLNAIGDSSRIVCNPLCVQADWILQQYKMINKMTLAGLTVSNSSSFGMSYAEEKFAYRFFAPTDPYSPAIWRGAWGYYPTGELYAPPEIPSIETLWGYGGFQVWYNSTAHYFAAAKRRQNTAEDSYGNPEAGIDDYADRLRSTATINLSASGLLANADITFHIAPLKLSKEPFNAYHWVNGEYVSYDIAEFNNELGAENSYLSFEKSGKSGASQAFQVGNIDIVPVAGTLVDAELNGASQNSYKNWVIYSDYDFYKDTEFDVETTWSKATADITKIFNFTA